MNIFDKRPDPAYRTGGIVHIAKPMAMIDAGAPIDPAWCDAGRWEIDIAGRRYPARASVSPLYDPAMKRVRG